MFRFDREKILPVFFQKKWTTYELARRAGCGHHSAFKAVNGERVAAPVITKVAAALNVDAVKFLAAPSKTTI